SVRNDNFNYRATLHVGIQSRTLGDASRGGAQARLICHAAYINRPAKAVSGKRVEINTIGNEILLAVLSEQILRPAWLGAGSKPHFDS
ncbi:hypothetical protein, partial [Pseudomonas syringae]|uniref:hypothetical protein n=1 Tax=Pseudomonas syringae TaxID=317 RepID=UPI001F459656